MLLFNTALARQALAQLPELFAQESLVPPALNTVYVPAQHNKALHLDASVVVGMRGAGKSWWTAVLASEQHRRFAAHQISMASLAHVKVSVGFGLDDSEDSFPRAETLSALLSRGIEPATIWMTVVLNHAAQATGHRPLVEGRAWPAAVQLVKDDPTAANNMLTAFDSALSAGSNTLLVLFDAFDRLANDWESVRSLTTGALQVGLRLRSRRAIRAKFFVRPDLEEDDRVWQFPDSSKLRHAKVDLEWTSADLYSLLFMRLGNTPNFGEEFRSATSTELGLSWVASEGVHVPPAPLCRDDNAQKKVLGALADRTMGSGPKRGYTYSWVPLHLADAKGRISPRSYLLAFKKAAEFTASRRPSHSLALDYSAIQEGVVRASSVRVDEISEDYPWVRPLLEAARGAVVPISPKDLLERWPRERQREMMRSVQEKLPPRRYSGAASIGDHPESLIEDLVELAVLYRTKDERLNIPDIFRVGFGIRRKGGVRPPR